MSGRKAHCLINVGVVLILAVALAFRLYGISWDRGYLFHPDERQILIVVDRISFPWPPDWALFFSPQSPWNPQFFAYGSLPIYLLRVLANLAGHVHADYATLMSSYIVGRILSALFDVGTVYLIYRLGRALYGPAEGLLAATFVALTVLHIQLAHFYTVDTLLTFFVIWTVLLAVATARHPTMRYGLAMGIVWGMALATKVSALPLAIPIGLAWFGGALAGDRALTSRWGRWIRPLWGSLFTGLVALLTFVLWQPYAVIDVVAFVSDIIQESGMARGVVDVPYTRQFIGTTPYLYPLQQMVTWSMGLPLGVAGLVAALAALGHLGYTIWRRRKGLGREPLWRSVELSVPLAWVVVYFGITGSFHAKFLRYMLPIIPFLCLWAAWALVGLWGACGRFARLHRVVGAIGLVTVAMSTALYALAYLNIYRQEHPWIQATAWLCENLPPNSRLMVEHWDDPLPLRQGTGRLRCFRDHEVMTFGAYHADTVEKRDWLLDALETNDYIILSSNRLYNTIPRLPERYPLTSRYYELLMAERLGFELVYYVSVYPRLLGIELVDDTFCDPPLPRPRLLATRGAERRQINFGRADESFSVYDHPKPLIFQKTRSLSRQELMEVLGEAARQLPAATR